MRPMNFEMVTPGMGWGKGGEMWEIDGLARHKKPEVVREK